MHRRKDIQTLRHRKLFCLEFWGNTPEHSHERKQHFRTQPKMLFNYNLCLLILLMLSEFSCCQCSLTGNDFGSCEGANVVTSLCWSFGPHSSGCFGGTRMWQRLGTRDFGCQGRSCCTFVGTRPGAYDIYGLMWMACGTSWNFGDIWLLCTVGFWWEVIGPSKALEAFLDSSENLFWFVFRCPGSGVWLMCSFQSPKSNFRCSDGVTEESNYTLYFKYFNWCSQWSSVQVQVVGFKFHKKRQTGKGYTNNGAMLQTLVIVAPGMYQIGFRASGSWPSPCVDMVNSHCIGVEEKRCQKVQDVIYIEGRVFMFHKSDHVAEIVGVCWVNILCCWANERFVLPPVATLALGKTSSQAGHRIPYDRCPHPWYEVARIQVKPS